MLTEATLFGTVDRVATAIDRLREFEPPEGYFVAFSGGKDSIVALDLVRREKAGNMHTAAVSVGILLCIIVLWTVALMALVLGRRRADDGGSTGTQIATRTWGSAEVESPYLNESYGGTDDE